MLAIGDDLHDFRLRLAEAEDGEAKDWGLHFRVENATDGVARVGPKMEYAFAFAGDRVAGGGEVEEEFAVFACHGVGVVGEEGFEEVREFGWGDGAGGMATRDLLHISRLSLRRR